MVMLEISPLRGSLMCANRQQYIHNVQSNLGLCLRDMKTTILIPSSNVSQISVPLFRTTWTRMIRTSLAHRQSFTSSSLRFLTVSHLHQG